MGQTTEDLQEELNSALRRAETAEYWIERNADFLHERAKSAEALAAARVVEVNRLRATLAEVTVALKDCRGVLQSCAEDVAGTPTEEFFKARVGYCDIVIAKAERSGDYVPR